MCLDRRDWWRQMVLTASLVVLLPTLAHFLFSAFGYNPTDDGFMLSYARRLLEGQVPHRDFISLRPVGSAILHAPFVLLGGQYTYWVDRWFVWVEFGIITWAWVYCAEILTERTFGWLEGAAAGAIGFVLTTHDFPVMAWYTIDGLMFVSLGLAMCVSAPRATWWGEHFRVAGYVLIGAAALCKQNFLLCAPAAVILLGDWKRPTCWIAAAVPGTAYVTWMWATGGIGDMWLQLTVYNGLLRPVGWDRYLDPRLMLAWGIVAGWLVMAVVRSDEIGWPRLQAAGVILLIVAAFRYLRVWHAQDYDGDSFPLFGAVMGATAYFLTRGREYWGYAALGLLALVTAWSTSISVSLRTPAMASAALVLALLAPVSAGIADKAPALVRRIVRECWLLAIAWPALFAWHDLRLTWIYRDLPAVALTCPLDGIFPGGSGLRTNENVCAFVADLNAAIQATGGRRYALVPAFPGWWAKAPQINPLPIDWVSTLDLPTAALLTRVTQAMDAQRGHIVVIVQNAAAAALRAGFDTTPDALLVPHLDAKWTKVGETRFFALYE